MPKPFILVGCLVAVPLIAGVSALIVTAMHEANFRSPDSSSSRSLINPAVINSLDKQSNSLVSQAHLTNGITLPTNKWFSSMVLNDDPKPGFNIPNSILLHDDGFELGLPNVTTTGDGIYGPHINGIQVSVAEARSFKLVRYDELTVTLRYYDTSDGELFDVTFASGSPYGFVTAKRSLEVTLKSGQSQAKSNGLTTFKNGDAWYGVSSSNGKTGTSLRLQKNDELAVFSASNEAFAGQLSKAAKYPIVSGEVSYELHDSKVMTTLHYNTKNNGQTILVHMPHQGKSSGQPVATYQTMYGGLPGYKSSKIEYSQPQQTLKWSLDVRNATASQKAELTTQLKTDIANSHTDMADTYFGGKQLQRLAQLVMIADSLGQTRLRDDAQNKLVVALNAWFDSDASKSFFYDSTAKAIVGREASFGSDKELNDHHFHYGYFIYAASVAAKFNKDFLSKHKDDVNLLVADIANYKSNESLPLRRNFDAYAGHSWASGISNYADGNNQESSGEAVNAWTGVGLWADITGNETLKNEASWLLANEVASAKKYWLSKPADSLYTSPLVSINWGGKREYKTFFSDEANAKVAIQLLPLNPTMKSNVRTLPESLFNGTDTKKQYGDYILMAMTNKNAFTAVTDYPDTLVDDGNSKAYMMAYALED